MSSSSSSSAAEAKQTQSKCPALLASPTLYYVPLAALLHWEELRMGGAPGVTSTWNVQRPGRLSAPLLVDRKASRKGKDKAEVPAGVEVHRSPVDYCSLSLSLFLSLLVQGPHPLPSSPNSHPEPAGPPRRIEDFRREIKVDGEFRNNHLDDSKSITVDVTSLGLSGLRCYHTPRRVKAQDPRPKKLKSWDKEHGAQSAEARSKLKAGAVDPSRLREIARCPEEEEEEEAYHYRWTPRSPSTHRQRSGWATANELEMIDIIPLLVRQDSLPKAASVFLPTDFPRHIDRVPKLSSPVRWEGKKSKKMFRQLGGLSLSCQCHSPMSVTKSTSKDHPYFPSPIKRAQSPHYHGKGRPLSDQSFAHSSIPMSRAGQGLEVLAPEKWSLAVVDEKPMSMLPDPGCPSSSTLLGSSPPPPNPAERCPQLLKSLSDLTKNLAAAVTVREGGGKKRRRLVRLSCIELNPSIRLERGEKSKYEAFL
ncbi:hypothetical protein CPAR01_00097 [Colletotrichum paranaense]|uniref:Uncharacterized protein n=1 Tax=Colletotrichum paranaense TaxID=1914294 RepID=A0ABQ9T2X9_9PEZI|nr:uncharacterized protein CPAR01_00097 [Colletotrichum paranaense]KAK1546130.1 hypothetical protein CPAR01_00097 [Colletotrichum paranaense]